MSEVTPDDEEKCADAEEGYDSDTLIDMVQTNFHNSTRQANVDQRRTCTQSFVPNNTRLPSDTWSQLSQDDRLMWMKLSRETKALILDLKPLPEPSIKRNRSSMIHDISSFEFVIKSPPEINNKGSIKFMLNDISSFEFISNIDHTYPTAQPDDASNDNNTTLLANATSLRDNNITPEDIRKMLSTTNSNISPNQKGKTTPINRATVARYGVKYMQCHTHITYRVSDHKHKKSSSLVDRGANGEITGNYIFPYCHTFG